MKRVLKSLAIGIAVYLIYGVISGALLMYYAGGDPNLIRSSPPFDIAARIPTMIFRYLFPEQVSNFYKPGFTSEKLLFASASFLMNVIIFSTPFYLYFRFRDRFKKIEPETEASNIPPPPPSFDD